MRVSAAPLEAALRLDLSLVIGHWDFVGHWGLVIPDVRGACFGKDERKGGSMKKPETSPIENRSCPGFSFVSNAYANDEVAEEWEPQ
jgi:hypothetical protein